LKQKGKMKTYHKIILPLFFLLSFWSCSSKKESLVDARRQIEITTNYGTVIVELYNETPLHRDNFIKLANDGAFDSLLFHRVINRFMIQGGDPDSKKALSADTLGDGDLPYTIDAEFNPALFHKKGVIAAARENNPTRASSAMQFYIVQGKVFNDSLLNIAEERINGWLAEYYTKHDPSNKSLLDSLQKAFDTKNEKQITLLNDSAKNLANTYKNFQHYTIPQAHREVYKTLGGTPHLDQNYTVFGEVVKGIEVVDSIAAVQTTPLDRPISDVRIQKIRVLK
jgi:cyclophilin family peptidyl-prolyl cis-trans isomerase